MLVGLSTYRLNDRRFLSCDRRRCRFRLPDIDQRHLMGLAILEGFGGYPGDKDRLIALITSLVKSDIGCINVGLSTAHVPYPFIPGLNKGVAKIGRVTARRPSRPAPHAADPNTVKQELKQDTLARPPLRQKWPTK